jgi:hypothetical protein
VLYVPCRCSDSASSKPNAASTLADASATDASQQATALSATTTAAVVLEAGPTEQPPPPPPSAEAAEVVLAPYSEALPSDDVEPQHRKKPPRPGRPPSSPSPPAHPEPKPPSRRCDALNFNGPWISGEASVSLTVVRKVTSVLAPKEGWVTFTAEGLPDAGSAFEVVVLPASFKMKGGRSQEVVITVKARAGTPLRQYQFGQVGLHGSSPRWADFGSLGGGGGGRKEVIAAKARAWTPLQQYQFSFASLGDVGHLGGLQIPVTRPKWVGPRGGLSKQR